MDKYIDIIGKRKEASVSDKSVPAKSLKKQAVDSMMTAIYNLVFLDRRCRCSPTTMSCVWH